MERSSMSGVRNRWKDSLGFTHLLERRTRRDLPKED
jgi:hypothetical protein